MDQREADYSKAMPCGTIRLATGPGTSPVNFPLGASASSPCWRVAGPPQNALTPRLLVLVGNKGLEPSRPCGHRILNPARLPNSANRP